GKYQVTFGTASFSPVVLESRGDPENTNYPDIEYSTTASDVVEVDGGSATLNMLKTGEQVVTVSTPATLGTDDPGGYDPYEEDITVNVVPGPAAKIAITAPDPATVVAGAVSGNFTVTVYDEN